MNHPGPPSTAKVVQVADLHPDCRVLGPGRRFAVWVQGCPLRCPGCISPQWLPFDGGTSIPVEELADRIVAEAVDGLTFSGGEPFAQASALLRLTRAVRARRDLSVLSYSGYSLGWLRRHGDDDQRGLLAALDLLIDGPYQRGAHADLPWRGSANQQVHLLSDRHRATELPRRGVGLQIELTAEGSAHWLGVPPYPDFLPAWERALASVLLRPPATGDPDE